MENFKMDVSGYELEFKQDFEEKEVIFINESDFNSMGHLTFQVLRFDLEKMFKEKFDFLSFNIYPKSENTFTVKFIVHFK